MNREILFRGKWIDNGEWVHGYLIGDDVIVGEIIEFEDEYFYCEFWWKVDPKTVGEFTGLCDKNGANIFEGDILKVDTEFENSTIHRVIWGGSYPAFEIEPNPYDDCNGLQYVAHVCENTTCQIIGNIHDNPDLLKGTNKKKNII